MKKHTLASNRKSPDSAQLGCSPRCDSSDNVTHKKMCIALTSDMDCNKLMDDGTAAVSSDLSPEIQVTPVQKMPERPDNCQFQGDSLLDLPMDLLVKIICHLHHDELPAVSQVCRSLRLAHVKAAKEFHFNYLTPDHGRQQALKRTGLASKDEGGAMLESPQCPGAPVQK